MDHPLGTDNIGSWIFICNLILTQLDKIWKNTLIFWKMKVNLNIVLGILWSWFLVHVTLFQFQLDKKLIINSILFEKGRLSQFFGKCTTSIVLKMEDYLNFLTMEDYLNFFLMEDNLNYFNKNWKWKASTIFIHCRLPQSWELIATASFYLLYLHTWLVTLNIFIFACHKILKHGGGSLFWWSMF